jgi:hypothetical protein
MRSAWACPQNPSSQALNPAPFDFDPVTVSPVSYPPQPQYGWPQQQPGYGYYQRPPSTAPAYLTAVLFLACAAMTFVFTFMSWDGKTDTPEVLVSLVGFAFSGDLTRNVDFAISASMTVACTTTLFALLMLGRLRWVRWVLVVLGAIVTAYYVYGVIWLLSKELEDYIGVAIAALLLWLASTIMAAVPITGKAMRGPSAQPGYYSNF